MTLRAFVENANELGDAVKHLEMTKVYSMNGEANARPMKFPDASAVSSTFCQARTAPPSTNSSNSWTIGTVKERSHRPLPRAESARWESRKLAADRPGKAYMPALFSN